MNKTIFALCSLSLLCNADIECVKTLKNESREAQHAATQRHLAQAREDLRKERREKKESRALLESTVFTMFIRAIGSDHPAHLKDFKDSISKQSFASLLNLMVRLQNVPIKALEKVDLKAQEKAALLQAHEDRLSAAHIYICPLSQSETSKILSRMPAPRKAHTIISEILSSSDEDSD